MFQPLFARSLKTIEKETLLQCTCSPVKEEAQRAEVILLSAQGKTIAEISDFLGFHPANIKKWIRSFNESGLEGIAVKKRGPQGGPRPKFTRTQIAEIVKLSQTDPTAFGLRFKEWTPQKLANYVIQRGVVDRISHVTVRQILKKQDEVVTSEPHESTLNSMIQKSAKISVATHLQIGKEAFNRSEYETAIEHLRLVIEDPNVNIEEDANVRLMLSQALEELSRYEEAHSVIKKYANGKLLVQLTPLNRAQMKLRLGWAESWLRNYPEAIAALNEAKKLFLELQFDTGVCEAHYALGRTYIEINEFRIARDHLLTAAKFHGKVYRPELMAKIYSRLGIVGFYEGSFANSIDNYLKALKIAEDTTNDNLIGMILLNLGTTYYEGYVAEQSEASRHTGIAAEYLERAVKHLEKGGKTDYLAQAYNNLGENFRYAGLWQKAIDNIEKAITITQSYLHPKYEATARITLSEILCARGAFNESEEHLMRSLALIKEEGDKWLESNALRILANVQRGKGKLDAALKTLREALQLSTSIGDMHGIMLSHTILAEFHLVQGGLEQAREYIELAQGRLKEEKSLFISGIIQRLTGKLEAESGRLAEAKQHIAQSISIFTTTDIPYESAKSHYEMGHILVRSLDFDEARRHFDRAKDIFEKLETTPDITAINETVSAMSSGAVTEVKNHKVAQPSDILLMQRLMDASASSELIIRELTSIIFDNFPVKAVSICRIEEDHHIEMLATQGWNRAEMEKMIAQLDENLLEKGGQFGNLQILKLGQGARKAIAVCIFAIAPLDMGRLQPLLKQVELGLEICTLRSAALSFSPPPAEHRIRTVMPGFIIGSQPMFDVMDKIQKIRTSNVTVLITGESGTGKELVARAIHAESARARAIFLPFNCTATPKEIIDSQLFGHRRGSFTGATENYSGIIRAADGGTLFLDEIGDLSLEVQPKLMRFLQEAEIHPLGETRPVRVDVRVLAATNSDLEKAVEDGRFRADLFHRLNIIRIHVPPLRERREEIPILATHFLDHFSSRSGKPNLHLTQDAIDGLADYDWPGNVRQLRNEIERVVAYAYDNTHISADDLSPEVLHPRRQSPKNYSRPSSDTPVHTNGKAPTIAQPEQGSVNFAVNGIVKLKDATAVLERQIILASLERNKNNLSRTAIELGLSRRGLRLKLTQLNIAREEGSL